jgi:hypothetical protein
MLRLLVGQIRRGISTDMIKKRVAEQLAMGKEKQVPEYPRTFEQKIIFLNDPKTIQKLEIVEYGVKYKAGKKYLSLALLLAGVFFYYNEQYLPVKVVDCYFCISNNSGLEYPSGFLLAPFMYELPFYIYTPLLLVVNQMSKFISNRWVLGLMATNAVVSGLIGKQLVDERVKDYEVWDQERISYGDGTLMALSTMLWGALGPMGGFTALKSRIMLESVPGLGITRAGIPLGYICLFYFLFELYCWK